MVLKIRGPLALGKEGGVDFISSQDATGSFDVIQLDANPEFSISGRVMEEEIDV